MKKYLTIYFLFVILAVALGTCFVMWEIKFSTIVYMWTSIFLGIIFVFMTVYLVKVLKYSLSDFEKGNYLKVIGKNEEKIELNREKINVTNYLYLNNSICLNRMGEFEKSNNNLEKIREFQNEKEIKWYYYFLKGTNMILEGKDIEKGSKELLKCRDVLDIKDIYPFLAFAEVVNKNKNLALKYLEEYSKLERKKTFAFTLTKAAIYFDEFTYQIENNFFIGYTYYQIGNIDKAVEYFKISENSKFNNYYSERSKEFIKLLEIKMF